MQSVAAFQHFGAFIVTGGGSEQTFPTPWGRPGFRLDWLTFPLLRETFS